MGQYFALVNLDKMQWVHAHQIGNGLKIGEQTGWPYSTEQVAKLLLAEPSPIHPLIGSWRGDTRIGFVGDYGGYHPAPDVPDHVALTSDPEKVYVSTDDGHEGWNEISAGVREMMTAVYGITYTGEGWLDILEPDGAKAQANLRPDMVFSVPK